MIEISEGTHPNQTAPDKSPTEEQEEVKPMSLAEYLNDLQQKRMCDPIFTPLQPRRFSIKPFYQLEERDTGFFPIDVRNSYFGVGGGISY